SFFAEIFAPLPGGDVGIDRVVKRIYTKCRLFFVESADYQRTKIAGFETALSYELDRCIAELLAAKCRIHPIDLGRIYEPLHVLRQPKYCRTLAGFVTA